MLKDFIFFIAYRACSGKNVLWKSNPFQYINSISLISFILLVHIIQITVFVKKGAILSIKSISGTNYLFILGGLLFIYFLIGRLFKRKDLPRIIRKYKDSKIDKYSKLIAFAYLIFNLILIFLLALR